jgi:hypothetical protein
MNMMEDVPFRYMKAMPMRSQQTDNSYKPVFYYMNVSLAY